MPQENDGKSLLWLAGIGVGGFLAYKVIDSLFLAPGRKEMQKIIDEKWVNADAYLDQMTTDGREPTETEMAIYNAMVRDMIDEEAMLPQPIIVELAHAAEELMKQWYLIPIAIVTPIAGYISLKLFQDWYKNKCRRCQPPHCPKCGRYFATVEQVQQHIINDHQPTTNLYDIREAQRVFNLNPVFVTGTVSVSSGLFYRAFETWANLAGSLLLQLASGATFCEMTGIGSAATAYSMRTVTLLLII